MNYNIDIVEYCKSKIVKTKKENRWATVLLEMCDDMIYMMTTKLLHGDNLPSTVSFCRVPFDNLCLANQLFFPLKNNGIKFYLSPFTILHFLALLFPSFPAALSGKRNFLWLLISEGTWKVGSIIVALAAQLVVMGVTYPYFSDGVLWHFIIDIIS